jgi:hypothetical protein
MTAPQPATSAKPDPWIRDDLRQSYITVALAEKGSPIPFVEASYRMYGLHPEKLYPAILARREALLGQSGRSTAKRRQIGPVPLCLPPKKPARKEVNHEAAQLRDLG